MLSTAFIADLSSPHHSRREQAVKELYSCRDIKVLEELFAQKRSDLEIIFINLLNDILNELQPKLGPWALKQLLSFIQKDRTTISKYAIDYLDGYFSNSEIYNHYKSYLIINVWKGLTDYHKLVITRLIRKNKFTSHSNLLTENFSSKDDELILQTIRAFRELNDHRGNSSIKDLLRSKNNEHVREAIATIGVTGNIFDSLALRPLLKSSDDTLLRECTVSYRKLLKNLAYYDLKDVYLHNKSTNVKLETLRQISKLNSKTALHFLLKTLLTESDHYLKLEITQAIVRFEIPAKDLKIIAFLKKLSLAQRRHSLNLLETEYSLPVKNYLISIVNHSSDTTERVLALELLSNFEDEKIISFLEKICESDDKYLALSAYDTLVKIHFKQSSQSVTLPPPHAVELESEQHTIYTKYLFKIGKMAESREDLGPYLLGLLQSFNVDVFFGALAAFRFHHNKDTILKFIEYYREHSRPEMKEHLIGTLRSILYSSSPFLDDEVIDKLPDETYVNLNAAVISEELLSRLMIYLAQNNNKFLSEFIGTNIELLNEKIARIFEQEGDFAMAGLIFKVANKSNVVFEPRQEKRIKRLIKERPEFQEEAIRYFLKKKSETDYDFVISHYRYILKTGLTTSFNQYLDEVL